MAEDSEVTDLIGEPLTEEDSDFIKNLQELLKAGIAEPIDGAKQVITTNGLLLTVYFVAISFGKFKDMSYESGPLYGIQTCLFLMNTPQLAAWVRRRSFTLCTHSFISS